MKLYRIVSDKELQNALNEGTFKTIWQYYEKDTGWAIFNGSSCINTFTAEQNNNLHFFKFPIDAVEYLYKDRKKAGESYADNSIDSFCVFDIPNNLLEKGYGFYPKKVALEYVAKEPISIKYLLSHTKYKPNMFQMVLEYLEETIKWYSTVGRACEMCLDNGFCMMNVGGIKKIVRVGGFIYSFGDWFSSVLSNFASQEEINEIMKYCYDANTICYQDLKKDEFNFSNMQIMFESDEVKSPQEAALIFNKFQDNDSFKNIAMKNACPKLIIK